MNNGREHWTTEACCRFPTVPPCCEPDGIGTTRLDRTLSSAVVCKLSHASPILCKGVENPFSIR
jgi:hypothetical protein